MDFGRLQNLGWEDEEQRAFGLVGRNSLDCWIERVGTRGRKTLVPIIDAHCKPGTVFTSDKWRAYYELEKHLETEDCLHYSVNHKKNFVDPETGAHTQTVEGMWRHMNDFFPKFGLRADHIDTYLGTFMWLCYVKQRKLDHNTTQTCNCKNFRSLGPLLRWGWRALFWQIENIHISLVYNFQLLSLH